MAQITLDAPGSEHPDPPEPSATPRRPRRLLWRVLIGIAVVVVVLLLAGVAWFFFGRDQATQRSTDAALDDFRQSGTAGAEAAGRPARAGGGAIDDGIGPPVKLSMTTSRPSFSTTR